MSASDDRVGRGRPPKHYQFKKGQSGNPKGRPKGSLNLRTMLERALASKACFTEKGRPKLKKKWEIAMMQLANRAAKGDLAAIRLVLSFRTLLESPSDDDWQELAEIREQKRRLETMSPEQLEARRRELDQMEEALKRKAAREEEIRKRNTEI